MIKKKIPFFSYSRFDLSLYKIDFKVCFLLTSDVDPSTLQRAAAGLSSSVFGNPSQIANATPQLGRAHTGAYGYQVLNRNKSANRGNIYSCTSICT